ncbi:unnamed protein product [Mycena citricolor]|uniref:K Homology domain-containing protein n=1 Tax=Mycena citricolor TaxID=2018698 RepID=A0AAD2Q1V4_9AGAR|nr:unnamed protein product [Mycena citricolor]
MATPTGHLDIYSYCELLRHEVQRLHDRLDRMEHGNTAASTPRGHAWRPAWDGARWQSAPTTPAPTPAVIAVGHTTIPLAETLPTAAGSPGRYSCTLVVPDSVVGHIVGRGGKGLHQAHDTSGAQLRVYTDKTSPAERHVSIRGTDQQVGEALIALGKRFMRKRVRTKKTGPPRPSGDPAPPPPGPAPAPSDVAMPEASPLKEPAPAARRSKTRQQDPPVPAASGPPQPREAPPPTAPAPQHRARARFAPQDSSLPAPAPLPHERATTPYAPTRAMATAIPTPQPNSTPFIPSVAMPTASSTPQSFTPAGSPMAIDSVRTGVPRRQTARRGRGVLGSVARTDSRGNLLFPGDPGYDRA